MFNPEFIRNNKKYCKILYNREEYDLQEEFKTKAIMDRETLEIKLKGISKITNMLQCFMDALH